MLAGRKSRKQVLVKLMRLVSANRIDIFKSKSQSEFDRPIIVDSDSNDLIESTSSIFDINRSIFDNNRSIFDINRSIFD